MQKAMTDSGLPLEAISKLRRVFERYPEIERVILYGSRAKGNYREGSDIDLTREGNISRSALPKLDGEIDDLLLPYKLDLSSKQEINNADLLAHIDRVGVVFFERPAQP